MHYEKKENLFSGGNGMIVRDEKGMSFMFTHMWPFSSTSSHLSPLPPKICTFLWQLLSSTSVYALVCVYNGIIQIWTSLKWLIIAWNTTTTTTTALISRAILVISSLWIFRLLLMMMVGGYTIDSYRTTEFMLIC